MALLRRSKPKTKPRFGKLIVLDGIDGSGKATQAKLLIETLELAGYKVGHITVPQYGQKSSQLLEAYLDGKHPEINPYAASVFYALNRFDISPQIKQWLEEGKVVVADRYVTSNAGHQGARISDSGERLKFFKWLNHLEYEVFGLPRPDLTIIFDVPATIAQTLVKKRGNKQDILEKDLPHLKTAAATYQQVATLFPQTKLVKCIQHGELLAPRQIHNQVWELVRRIALKDFPV